MLFVPLWFCTLPAVLSLRCRFFSQNNRPVYECVNVSAFGTEVQITDIAAAGGRGVILPIVPPGTMTFKIAHTRIETLARVGNPEIVTLSVNFCELRSVAADAFARSTNLKQIDLSHNLLTHLSFDTIASLHPSGPPTHGVPRVERLILAYNRFETIPDLSLLHTLRDLDLSHNQIMRIPDRSLLLPRLEWIDLSHNSLTRIRRSDFGRAIRIVELNANPWNCDCKLRDFVAFQRETLISRSLRCKEPPPLRGIKWDDLALSDFACGPRIKQPLYEAVNALNGERITLTCEVSGDPTPSVSWKRNDSTISLGSAKWMTVTSKQPQQTFFVDGQPATIDVVDAEDENTYWCVARAGYNTLRKRFDLTLVNSPSEISENTGFHETPHGENELSSSEDDGLPKKDREYRIPGGRENEERAMLAERHPIWTLLLISVVALACLLLIAFCVFVFRMQKANYENRNGNRKYFTASDEEVPHSGQRTSKGAAAILEIQNGESGIHTELLNSEAIERTQKDEENTDLVKSESEELHRCFLDEWTPKAPLAQYDTDTSVLPIVQTSL
uniref:Ig-like domain-containing protein n=1 Tax=Parascaris univalens TaxID=6257 RepID=A0A915B1I4_PARUN